MMNYDAQYNNGMYKLFPAEGIELFSILQWDGFQNEGCVVTPPIPTNRVAELLDHEWLVIEYCKYERQDVVKYHESICRAVEIIYGRTARALYEEYWVEGYNGQQEWMEYLQNPMTQTRALNAAV